MRVIRRLGYWFRLRSNHADLQDELAFHREMMEQELVRGGLSPHDAHARAKRTMGNETFMREEARSVWLWPSLEALWQDASYTCRGLARTPTFTLGVTLTLALGIGANAAMFSLVDRLLFRPPALMIDPATVHQVYMYRTAQGRESETGGQYARYADMALWSSTAVRTAAFTLKSLAIGSGEATRIQKVGIVTASFFEFFNAALGLYSVIAYTVEQRQHELGVRLALGAARAGIVRLVVAQSLRFAVVGVIVGGVGVLAGGRWIAPLLFRQSPNDAGVFGVVTAVLIGVAIAASAFPAWRAARLDPRVALQAD